MIIGDRLHEHDFRSDILCDLFDLEFPEVGCLHLELSPGYCNDTKLGRLDTFADFLAFTHINFHGIYLITTGFLQDIRLYRDCGSGISIGLRELIPFDGHSIVADNR